MTNEWEEYLAYTLPPKYECKSKNDNSYLGRFTTKMIYEVVGFARTFTILARGFLFHNPDGTLKSGDTALNLLGLSTQVPSQWVYVSDGAYKEYSFGNTVVSFKKTANKEISNVSYKTALVIQALKAYGKENITDEILIRLQKALTNEEKQRMFTESKSVTAWIYEYIRAICKNTAEEKV